MGNNVIIVGVDMRVFVHIDNKSKNILILGEGPKQKSDDTTLTAEAKYPINFSQPRKGFVFVKHSVIKDYTPCLGNISKYFTINNTKKKVKRIVKLCEFKCKFHGRKCNSNQ